MGWGKVTIAYQPTGYSKNYKRNNVVTHLQCANMVAAAVAHAVAQITANPPRGGLPGPVVVTRSNIGQDLPDPGINYSLI